MIDRRELGGDVYHLVDGAWVTVGGDELPEEEVADLSPVEQPPDGLVFATLRDLDNATIGAVVGDVTGNLIYKRANGTFFDEEAAATRSMAALAWDGCWLTGESADEDDEVPVGELDYEGEPCEECDGYMRRTSDGWECSDCGWESDDED